jgi:hypothetical protein
MRFKEFIELDELIYEAAVLSIETRISPEIILEAVEKDVPLEKLTPRQRGTKRSGLTRKINSLLKKKEDLGQSKQLSLFGDEGDDSAEIAEIEKQIKSLTSQRDKIDALKGTQQVPKKRVSAKPRGPISGTTDVSAGDYPSFSQTASPPGATSSQDISGPDWPRKPEVPTDPEGFFKHIGGVAPRTGSPLDAVQQAMTALHYGIKKIQGEKGLEDKEDQLSDIYSRLIGIVSSLKRMRPDWAEDETTRASKEMLGKGDFDEPETPWDFMQRTDVRKPSDSMTAPQQMYQHALDQGGRKTGNKDAKLILKKYGREGLQDYLNKKSKDPILTPGDWAYDFEQENPTYSRSRGEDWSGGYSRDFSPKTKKFIDRLRSIAGPTMQ